MLDISFYSYEKKRKHSYLADSVTCKPNGVYIILSLNFGNVTVKQQPDEVVTITPFPREEDTE